MQKLVLTIAAAAAILSGQKPDRNGEKPGNYDLIVAPKIADGVPGGVIGGVHGGVIAGIPGGFDFGGSFFLQKGRDTGDRDYERGQRALEKRTWEEAIASFDGAAARKGERADGALYWKAYALNKVGRRDEATATLEQLKKEYASSRWLDDAKALELEMKQASGQAVSPESQSDEDLKLMALNGIVQSDPERAMPILEKLLKSSSSPKLKERALFVLAQSNSTKARDLLAQIAKGGSNPDLQLKAINYLGVVHGSASNRQLLGDIYASSSDVPVKRAILRVFMQAGDRDRLFQAAKTEKNPELRGEAVNLLGVSGGADQLWQLYQSESDAEVRQRIIRALFVAGRSDRILEIARNEKEPKLRSSAIRSLGQMGHRGADVAALYPNESDPEIKKQIINALFIQNNAKALVDIARKETDAGMKKEIVNKLSHMNSKEGAEYMMELLSK